jgi:hypothetical protein
VGRAGAADGEEANTRATRRHESASRWRITHLKGTQAKFLGYVQAPDEKAAIKAAVKEFKIAQALRDRIVVQRDEL